MGNCYRCDGPSGGPLCESCLEKVDYYEVTLLVPKPEWGSDLAYWDWTSLIETDNGEEVYVQNVKVVKP